MFCYFALCIMLPFEISIHIIGIFHKMPAHFVLSLDSSNDDFSNLRSKFDLNMCTLLILSYSLFLNIFLKGHHAHILKFGIHVWCGITKMQVCS